MESNPERRKRSSPVGVRLGLSRPALIQRRIVGAEIARCLQAAAVLSQGSGSEWGTVWVVFAFMVRHGRSYARNYYRKPGVIRDGRKSGSR